MSETAQAYPLQWPQGWPRSLKREEGRFHRKEAQYAQDGARLVDRRRDLSIAEACKRILAELTAMDVRDDDVAVSTNLRPRLDGMPSVRAGHEGDPGVAVYWRRKGKQQCIAIDRYYRVADNLAAVAATLSAMRAIDRHGGAQILDRAFTGFTALPAPEQWWQVLGVNHYANQDEIESAYKRLAMEHHPDRGGDSDRMARINAARDQGLTR